MTNSSIINIHLQRYILVSISRMIPPKVPNLKSSVGHQHSLQLKFKTFLFKLRSPYLDHAAPRQQQQEQPSEKKGQQKGELACTVGFHTDDDDGDSARLCRPLCSLPTVSFQSIEISKKVFGGIDNIFHVYLMRGFQKYGRNLILTVAFWLCYFAGSSKSHRENSISFIFLEFPHQVDMKNVVNSSKHFFGYFNTLETHSERLWYLFQE